MNSNAHSVRNPNATEGQFFLRQPEPAERLRNCTTSKREGAVRGVAERVLSPSSDPKLDPVPRRGADQRSRDARLAKHPEATLDSPSIHRQVGGDSHPRKPKHPDDPGPPSLLRQAQHAARTGPLNSWKNLATSGRRAMRVDPVDATPTRHRRSRQADRTTRRACVSHSDVRKKAGQRSPRQHSPCHPRSPHRTIAIKFNDNDHVAAANDSPLQ